MTILLTGATGFIGRRLAPALLALADRRVVCAGRPGSDLPDGAERLDWDLHEPLDRARFPERVDAVVHFALAREFRAFPESVADLYAVNVRATLELLEYAREAGAGHFVMASTGNCYAPDGGLAVGATPVPPNDFYTAAKLAAEALTRPYRSCFPVNVMRIFFPYGPGQDAEKTVPRLIERVRAGQAVALETGLGGDGSVLSLTHVDDLVPVIVRSVTEKWNGLFDVAGPETLSVRAIIGEIGRQLGVEPRFSTGDEPAKAMTADLGALGRRYDLAAFRPFAEGLATMVAAQAEAPA